MGRQAVGSCFPFVGPRPKLCETISTAWAVRGQLSLCPIASLVMIALLGRIKESCTYLGRHHSHRLASAVSSGVRILSLSGPVLSSVRFCIPQYIAEVMPLCPGLITKQIMLLGSHWAGQRSERVRAGISHRLVAITELGQTRMCSSIWAWVLRISARKIQVPIVRGPPGYALLLTVVFGALFLVEAQVRISSTGGNNPSSHLWIIRLSEDSNHIELVADSEFLLEAVRFPLLLLFQIFGQHCTCEVPDFPMVH